MARLGCMCGAILSNVSSPNNVEFSVFSEWTISELGSADIGVIEPDAEIWKCPECGRLCWFEKESVQGKWFKPEDTKP